MVAKQSLLLCLLSGYTVKCLPRDQEVGGSSLARRSEILRPYLTFREVYGMCAYELIHKSTLKLSLTMNAKRKATIFNSLFKLFKKKKNKPSITTDLKGNSQEQNLMQP